MSAFGRWLPLVTGAIGQKRPQFVCVIPVAGDLTQAPRNRGLPNYLAYKRNWRVNDGEQ